tara:strand:- start:126 stop:449 length:324 start_codon:yes stop_codon:yes gene_type:complete
MRLNLRDLDRRVVLERGDTGQDSAGEAVTEYVHVARVWAKVQSVSGAEAFAAQQRYATVTHRIWIQYRADVTPEHRIVIDGRPFDVFEVIEFGRQEWLEIRATARAE